LPAELMPEALAEGGRPKVTLGLVVTPPGVTRGDPNPPNPAAPLLLGVLFCCCCGVAPPPAAAAAGLGEGVASKLVPLPLLGLSPGVLVVAPKLSVWCALRSLPAPPAPPLPPPAADVEAGVAVSMPGVSTYLNPAVGAGVLPANMVNCWGPPGVAAGPGVL
jgi:hypothetical protein